VTGRAYIYSTNFGDVRISEAEYHAIKAAQQIREHPHLRGSVLEKKALAMEAAIVAACERFAKHKYFTGWNFSHAPVVPCDTRRRGA
jgi:hypothetical protein